MKETSSAQFGLLVAHILPGFIGLAGVIPLFPAVGEWLQPVSLGDAGFGPPVYALMAATTVGMIVGCVRWLVIDHVLHWTGVKPPQWDLSQMEIRLEAFDYIVEGSYRYYQFFSNALVAVLWAYGMNRFYQTLPLLGTGTDLGVLLLCVVLFAGSRDCLTKYYTRTGQLVGQVTEKGLGTVMTNGFHHDSGGGESTRKQAPRPQGSGKPAVQAKPQPVGNKTAASPK